MVSVAIQECCLSSPENGDPLSHLLEMNRIGCRNVNGVETKIGAFSRIL
jgi:hypothetical protein